MPFEYGTITGSGTTPLLALCPIYDFPDGTFPIPSQRDALRSARGDGVVVLNPENFSLSVGLKQRAISVSAIGIALPAEPLENRRALVLHNSGPGILYIGLSDVSTLNGFPIAVNEKIAIDCQGTPNITLYGISDSTCDVRILEFA